MSEEKQEVIEVVEEQKKWTFANYFRGIKKYKWWVIGFTAGGCLGGFLGFRFALNPMTKKLTATFTYELAGAYEDNEVIRLVDGSSFNPLSLANYENLQAVKASSNAYAKVNVDTIYEDGSINVSKEVTTYGQGEKETYYIVYSVEAPASSFPNDKIGRQFVYDLVKYPTIISGKAADNYVIPNAFTATFTDLVFERQISQLATQYQSIEKMYEGLAKKFDSSVIVKADGTKLSESKIAFESNYSSSSIQSFSDQLSSELYSEKYVNYVPGQEAAKIIEVKKLSEGYIQSLSDKEKQKTIIETKISNLKSTLIVQDDTKLTEELSKLTEEMAALEEEIKDLTRELIKNGYKKVADEWVYDGSVEDSVLYKLNHPTTDWTNGCQVFAGKIASYKTLLEADRLSGSEAFRYCYKTNQNRVIIQNGGYVAVKGAIPNVVGVAAGLLVGFLASSLITAAVYIYKKEEK